ncbi:MAG: aminotransferase class III-fold pyridoxal phosphate-dependent enzyme, partial [Sporomusaceae bacterium]|nr:aminotransferase class III-fold pyridoxal phosphate-dependent enzyme [Sporomusaceae bacterium]
FKEQGEEIAAVIIEPEPGNMGLILPQAGYLEAVRAITAEYGALLIFDEVMSGFRVAHGGAQAVYKITPDLTCIGKVIGGGLPVGAYGGAGKIMSHVAPAGSVYQAGTLSGNPLAMAAGIATLEELAAEADFYPKLTAKTALLCAEVAKRAKQHGVKCQFHQIGSMFTVFFSDKPVYDYESAKLADTAAFSIFFNAMLEEGIYLAPSQFEAGFVSAAHSDADLEATIKASSTAFAKVAAASRKNYH